MAKIDASGEYRRFPGVTVVCDLPPDLDGGLAGLAEVLSSLPTLGPLVSPLPPESYHVTVLSICCQYRLGDDDAAWRERLRDARWAMAATTLLEADLAPRLRAERVTLHGTAIGVELAPLDRSVPAAPADLPLVGQLRELLSLPGRMGLRPRRGNPWHVTLGYFHSPKALRACEAVDIEADRRVLEAAVLAALPGAVVSLSPARLCRFEDMTCFSPWDGRDGSSLALSGGGGGKSRRWGKARGQRLAGSEPGPSRDRSQPPSAT